MRTADLDLLFVAGLNGSGSDHWQTRWSGRLPTAKLVEQADWDRPQLAAWTDAIVAAGESGHINADSGHGPWPEGLMLFAGFIKTL